MCALISIQRYEKFKHSLKILKKIAPRASSLVAPFRVDKISYYLSAVYQRVTIIANQNSESIFFMILCLIQSSDIKQIFKFFFQASVVVELRVVNPDAVGSEDVIFCFSIELEVIDRPLLT